MRARHLRTDLGRWMSRDPFFQDGLILPIDLLSVLLNTIKVPIFALPYAANNPTNLVSMNGLAPQKPEKQHLKPCPPPANKKERWIEGIASTWTCKENQCLACGVYLSCWPKEDKCRHVKPDPTVTPRSCYCKYVWDELGDTVPKIAAYKPKICGGKLKVFNRKTGDLVTVTVVDAGPYVAGRLIDLHQNIFGFGLWPVCVSEAEYNNSSRDTRLHDCWDNFG